MNERKRRKNGKDATDSFLHRTAIDSKKCISVFLINF